MVISTPYDGHHAKETNLTRKPRAPKRTLAPIPDEPALLAGIQTSLDDGKAEDIVTIDMKGRSSLCDALVIATGRSARHVAALAENLATQFKQWGFHGARIEGLPQGDWVLIDAGDVIVHLFRAEVRAYYDIESMWRVDERAGRKRAAQPVVSAV